MSFESRYSRLNDAQKQAVDTIDGPVMIVAGPGTGKTELLSVLANNPYKSLAHSRLTAFCEGEAKSRVLL